MRRAKMELLRNFCLVPKVAEHIVEMLALNAEEAKALCGFEPCLRPTGQESFCNPTFRIGTGTCHPRAPSLRGIHVYLSEGVGTPKLTDKLERGIIQELYLAPADGRYFERNANAGTTSLREATRFDHVSTELYVNVKLEKNFRGHGNSGNLLRFHLPAARAQGRLYMFKSQVFMLCKTAKAILNGCSMHDIARIDKKTFEDVLATYEKRLAQAQSSSSDYDCEDGRKRGAQPASATKAAASKASGSESSRSDDDAEDERKRGAQPASATKAAASKASGSESSSSDDDAEDERKRGAQAASATKAAASKASGSESSSSDDDAEDERKRGAQAASATKAAASKASGSESSSSDDDSDEDE
jgi:hypothetical protein